MLDQEHEGKKEERGRNGEGREWRRVTKLGRTHNKHGKRELFAYRKHSNTVLVVHVVGFPGVPVCICDDTGVAPCEAALLQQVVQANPRRPLVTCTRSTPPFRALTVSLPSLLPCKSLNQTTFLSIVQACRHRKTTTHDCTASEL